MTIPSDRLPDLVTSDDILERGERILSEFRNRNKLQKYGLTNRRKILIEGKPGTGKTITAPVIASELDLPLYTVQMDRVVTKFMGETSVKLRQIFDAVSSGSSDQKHDFTRAEKFAILHKKGIGGSKYATLHCDLGR